MLIPCVTVAIKGEKIDVIAASMRKAECLDVAKKYAAELVTDEAIEVRVLVGLGSAIQFRRRVLPNKDAAPESDPDVKVIRDALKAKGVNVPPRISVEKLLELAIANGVEA